MIRPEGRHGDHDGVRGHRTSRAPRGLLPALLVLFLVPVILILKVPTAITSTVPCDCQTCHTDPHAGNYPCGGCHGLPPATGSHGVHFDDSAPLAGIRYGDATNRSTAAAYIFDCGNCHSLDPARHMDGTVDVELYNPSAPAESLKAKNPASAAWDNNAKTCSDVYCHSGYSVASTSPVGLPLTSPPNPIPPGGSLMDSSNVILDNTGNLTYDPYTFTIARDYRTTPAWGTTGTYTTCGECHAFPLTTWEPGVYAMVGDSHQWVDATERYNWGHAYNMLGSGVPCATCHNSSVDHSGGGPYPQVQTATPPTYWTEATGPTYSAWINAYVPAPIKNRSVHVNGRPDVAFDTVYGYRYYNPYWGTNEQKDLTAATYDAPTKTCSDVSCHINQTNVKWGTPYRDEVTPECNICHRM